MIYRLYGSRSNVLEAIKTAPEGYMVEVKEPNRTLEQNALLWALLRDVARQVKWYDRRLTTHDWKAMFTASLKKSDVVPGIDGGFVVLGQSTSKMSKKEFSDLCELIYSFGAEHGVIWSDEQSGTAVSGQGTGARVHSLSAGV